MTRTPQQMLANQVQYIERYRESEDEVSSPTLVKKYSDGLGLGQQPTPSTLKAHQQDSAESYHSFNSNDNN